MAERGASMINKNKFWSKIQILSKTQNFGPKPKFWPKIRISAKNHNFGQKSEF